MQKVGFILFVYIFLVSCFGATKKPTFINKSFSEIQQISQESGSSFCLILYDSTQGTPNDYINNFKICKIPLGKVVCNFIDINLPQNKWYRKTLSPKLLPVMCLFGSEGDLIDLIPGDTKESLLYFKKAIQDNKPNLEFHYNQKYGDDKLETINLINRIIELKFKIDNHHNVVREVDSLLDISKCPYLIYLKLQNQLDMKDSVAAIKTAKELLLFDSAQDLHDYHNEFMIANQTIDKTYNSKTGPRLIFNSSQVEISGCNLNKTEILDIHIKNAGFKPLKISDILMSCSCVELVSEKRHIINPGENLTVKIKFKPDVKGDIFREVYIASNSVDSPISVFTIKAYVQ